MPGRRANGGAFEKAVNYADGSPALREHLDGGTFCYYPSGQLAVSVSVLVSGNQVRTMSYFYANNARKDLIGVFDNNGMGYIQEGGKTKRKLVISMKVDRVSFELLDKDGVLIPRTKGVGASAVENYSFPLHLVINEFLTFKYVSMQDIVVTFKCDTCEQKFPLIRGTTPHSFGVQRRKNAALADPHRAATPKDTKDSGKQHVPLHRSWNANTRLKLSEVSGIMSNLNSLSSTFGSTFSGTAHLGMKTAQYRDNTTANTHRSDLASQRSTSRRSRPPSSSTRSSSRQIPVKKGTDDIDWNKTTLDFVNQMIEEKNPVLHRGNAIRGMSGKYCLETPLPPNELHVVKLDQIGSATFEETLRKYKDQLVCICCFASWDSCSAAVQQMVEINCGALERSNDLRFQFFKFDMSESRYLIDKYNLRTLPSVLMYYNGKLVRAQHIGGPAIRRRIPTPKILFVEADTQTQFRLESVMKRELCDWDLVIDYSHFRRFQDMTIYSILVIDLDMDARDVAAIRSLLRSPTPSGSPYVIGMSSTPGAEHSITCDAVIPKPATSRDFLRELLSALKVTMPSTLDVAHQGVNSKDFMKMVFLFSSFH